MGRQHVSYNVMLATYISYILIVVIGHIRDQIGKIFVPKKYKCFYEQNKIPPLYTTFESFFIRRIYKRISDCWNRPISSTPGKNIKIEARISTDDNSTFQVTGTTIPALNLGSYDYLGFASEPTLTRDECIKTLESYNLNSASAPCEYVECPIVQKLEQEMADFLHKEDCIVFSMGFGTNSWVLSALVNDSLVFSDVNNHTSIICGVKLTNAHVVIFEHNNMASLESKLRFYLSQGQPETHRIWKKVFVIVEGIYSMEGTIVKLNELVELKKKYKFYLYVDEAHSIGAIGKTGRGVSEHLNVNFSDVDILMGTFSKSFCGAGGYVSGSKSLIRYLRANCDGVLYAEQLAPVVATQILFCLRKIVEDSSRIVKLRENTLLLREKLKKLSFPTLGDKYSPVVPVLIYAPGKLGEFSRLCLLSGLAVVVVGYPATPVLESRARLCLSSSLTREEIEKALVVIDNVGTVLGLKAPLK
ncbi:serine palmitoyltransferase [Pancytospora epiphaga]|nr:serine palmitoyltransferase [Pancytospora epiphaga]